MAAAAPTKWTPKPGDVLILDREASPQFTGLAMRVRVIKAVERRSSVSGWASFEVYQLDQHGEAVARRSVFLHVAALGPLHIQ
ncbi:hypothetical protein Lfu02_15340 [Longispora fulva]|uniref:Uncharacterized protein n=1 Tax=Longispora fulva TaxID=619741 RepID=A0A8J7GLI9_9ACTN|nr:hypothetical protein [Longispora fulva]MBG6140456.1 hypothetical protein [Longispora fulva]GIG57162.1 hypothetical protein Lfu02_15340 [Longispora fulva]